MTAANHQADAAVRSVGAEDLSTVADIYAHYVLNSVATFEEVPLTQDGWRRRLEAITAEGLPFLVAEVDGKVMGYAYGTRWRPRPAYRHTVEDCIYIAPEAVGRRIGTRLLQALLAGCEAAGRRQAIAVIVAGADPASVALHRRCGFTEAGRLTAVGFKHDHWLDTILMQRSLGDWNAGLA